MDTMSTASTTAEQDEILKGFMEAKIDETFPEKLRILSFTKYIQSLKASDKKIANAHSVTLFCSGNPKKCDRKEFSKSKFKNEGDTYLVIVVSVIVKSNKPSVSPFLIEYSKLREQNFVSLFFNTTKTRKFECSKYPATYGFAIIVGLEEKIFNDIRYFQSKIIEKLSQSVQDSIIKVEEKYNLKSTLPDSITSEDEKLMKDGNK
jgi:hypothetical protein